MDVSSILGLLLGAFVLAVWIGVRIEDTRELRANCRHEWEEVSLLNEEKLWNKRCRLCGQQEPVRRP